MTTINMATRIETEGLHCFCSTAGGKERIAYVLYPMDMLSGWIEPASRRYSTSIAVVTGMDWQNVFSPWPAKGVPAGSPDFKGESPEFLSLLCRHVVPEVESVLGIKQGAERTLVGVSMSGLFALWQWMECDIFSNIASLSGSFWFQGFLQWMRSLTIPKKKGTGFFLLGDKESKTNVKGFSTVAANTAAIMKILQEAGVKVEFESVPGNHYANPIPRLEKAFSALFTDIHRQNESKNGG